VNFPQLITSSIRKMDRRGDGKATMKKFDFQETDIPGLIEISGFYAEDNRGFFRKDFERGVFAEYGIEFHCDEEFISCSAKNVIRGMHFQLRYPQAKIVGVFKGAVFDVVVDLRRESPTFGQWRGFQLSEENHKNLYLPRGCAHGFLSLADGSMMSYQCDGPYDQETDTGILYNDPEIGVDWPIADLSAAILNEKDRRQMTFADFKRNCFFS
jgi:dTDP-4-dehydrorhamnose 3,5-epimerase